MKTLIIVSALAALAALSVSPLSFESTVSAFVVVGFVAIVLGDYSRKLRPLATEPVSVGVAARSRERFGLAA
jgi:hypothetical protein